jgi:TonB family protein
MFAGANAQTNLNDSAAKYCSTTYPLTSIKNKQNGLVILRSDVRINEKETATSVVYSNVNSELLNASKNIAENCNDDLAKLNETHTETTLYKGFVWKVVENSINLEVVEIKRSAATEFKCPQLQYPKSSRRMEEEGSVKLKLRIQLGDVLEIELEKSSNFAQLDVATILGAAGCRFNPEDKAIAKKNGWKSVIYTWRLM